VLANAPELRVTVVLALALHLAGCRREAVGTEQSARDETASNVHATQRLVGNWHTYPSDATALKEFGSVRLRFEDDGVMAYLIEGDTKDQVILLTYEIDGDELVTDQPSAPRKERTRVSFTPDGRLLLTYRGSSARYVRTSED